MKNKTVQRYIWQELSPIREVDISYDGKGHGRARLTAREDLEQGSLAQLPAMLHRYGLGGAYADSFDGKNVLVVPDVKDPKRLISVLQNAELTQGNASVTQSHADKQSPGEKINNDSLKLSGAIGLIGHASLAISGALQGRWGQVAAGPLGASTAGIVARYGNGHSAVDVDELLHHVQQYFKEEGLDFKPLDGPEAKKNILQKVQGLVAKHPLPIAYTIGSLGSLGLIGSGFNEVRGSAGKDGKSKLAVGLATLIGNMAVVFVPETPKNKEETEQQPKQSGREKFRTAMANTGDLIRHPSKIPSAVSSFVSRSPLFFMSVLNGVDNVLYFLMAKGEWNKMKRWAEENPAKIEEARLQEKTLLDALPNAHASSPHEYNVRLQEVGKVNSNILKMEKEHKLATSMRGKAVPWLTMVTAVTFAAATVLTSISSKIRTASEADKETHSRLYAALGKLVMQQDPPMREEMLLRMGTLLREDLKHTDISGEDLIQEIRNRMKVMEKSPFAAPGAKEQKAQDKDLTHVASLDQYRQFTPVPAR